jgi:hypothetical protein
LVVTHMFNASPVPAPDMSDAFSMAIN